MNYYDEIYSWEKELMNPYSEKYDCTECPFKKNKEVYLLHCNNGCELRQYGECPASIAWDQGFNVNRRYTNEVDSYYIDELEAEQRRHIDDVEELECDISELNNTLYKAASDYELLQQEYFKLSEQYNKLSKQYNKLLEETTKSKEERFW